MDRENLPTKVEPVAAATRLQYRKKRMVSFRNLTEKQRNLLNASAAGFSGVSLGVLAAILMGSTDANNLTPPIPGVTAEPGDCDVSVQIFTDAPFADTVSDDMSFGDAFRAARSEVGCGGVFEWRGKLYNTFLKEEWDTMSHLEKQEFYSSIDSSYSPGSISEESEILDILNDLESDTDLYMDAEEDIVILEDEVPLLGEEVIVISAEEDILSSEQGHVEHDAFETDSDDLDFDIDDPIIITED